MEILGRIGKVSTKHVVRHCNNNMGVIGGVDCDVYVDKSRMSLSLADAGSVAQLVRAVAHIIILVSLPHMLTILDNRQSVSANVQRVTLTALQGQLGKHSRPCLPSRRLDQPQLDYARVRKRNRVH